MIIARKNDYALRLKNYLGTYIYTTHDIEIVKYEYSDIFEEETCYTIARFSKPDKDGCCEVVCCGNRMLEALECMEDIDDIHDLIEIGMKIIATEEIESGYEPPAETVIKSRRFNMETGEYDPIEEHIVRRD